MSRTESTMVELGSIAPPFELPDVVTGGAVGRDDLAADAKGMLVMFVCVHCPFVKHVEAELARIGIDYEGKIGIAAISSNDVDEYPQDAPAEMKLQAQRLGWRFPYLYDESQEVARSYHAACTPDFFLFDAEMKLVYRGQLDSSRPRRGDSGNDGPVTGEDLRRAMDDVLAGKRPTPTSAAASAATSSGKNRVRIRSMDEVLEHLKQGIRRFRTEVYPEQADHYRRVMAEPQSPDALIITCADSRIHPDALTQSRPGEIFVTRNIGNMVPTYGEMLGGVSAVLEFAVAAMQVRHIVVCGHTDCGAMKALLNPHSVDQMPTVRAWLRNAHAALATAHALQPQAEGDDLLRLLTEQNVLLQMHHLRTHPAVAAAMAGGNLTISGWIYDIAAGEVTICEGDGCDFIPLTT